MKTRSLPLLLSMLTLTGCVGLRQDVMPEMGVAHQTADPVTCDILVSCDDPKRPDIYVRKRITYPAGAWIRLRTDTPTPTTKATP